MSGEEGPSARPAEPDEEPRIEYQLAIIVRVPVEDLIFEFPLERTGNSHR